MSISADPASVAAASHRLTIGAALPRFALAAGELAVLRWLVPLALLHGLLYVLIFPPWQHYDETAHFLYAAEIAAGELDTPGPASAAISREIADSMYRFRFYQPEMRPDLLGPAPPAVGIDQRVHPPLYYALVALPLRALNALSIEQQLYAARAVSLVLYVLTVVTAWRIAVALVPDEPLMQVVIPLLLLLEPAFADIMAAVNNDTLLNFSATAALLGAVLLVRDGLRPLPLALAILGMLVALMTKRVAMVASVPLLLAMVWSVRRAPLRWWGLPLLIAGAVALFGVACLEPTVVDGPSGAHTVLSVRPWFASIAESYLRINLDAVVRSISDPSLIGGRYQGLVIIAFGGFYTHFAWGQVTLHPAWTWALSALAALATVGLLVGGFRSRAELPLWQPRCLWIFLLAVISAWVSLFVRMHPLPPVEVPVYIPRGRYMFWAIMPNLWLLALGLSWATPAGWRRFTPYALLGFLACLDLSAWLWSIVNYYYR